MSRGSLVWWISLSTPAPDPSQCLQVTVMTFASGGGDLNPSTSQSYCFVVPLPLQ